jgi:hypothetical protein
MPPERSEEEQSTLLDEFLNVFLPSLDFAVFFTNPGRPNRVE